MLPDDAADHPAGGGLAERARQAASRSARRSSPPLPEAERRALRRRARAARCAAWSAARRPRCCTTPTRPAILEFVGSARGEELAATRHDLSRSLPAHQGAAAVRAVRARPRHGRRRWPRGSRRWSTQYRDDYTAYYERCKRAELAGDARSEPGAAARSRASACSRSRRTSRRRASPPSTSSTPSTSMRWAEGVDEYVPIAEQEAFDIEYWLLEEAKLQRLPKPKRARGADRARHRRRRRHRRRDRAAAARRGRARRADRHRRGGARRGARARWRRRYGADRVRGVRCDVTDEASVRGVVRATRRASSAASTSWSRTPASPRRRRSRRRRWRPGSATSTSWRPATSWSAREAFALMKRQGRGGSIVFVGSKNALVASPGASAYCAAKAAALHLARCLAVEGRRARHPRQRRQPRRGDPRLAHLGRHVARRARRQQPDRGGRGRGVLPPAQPAEAQRAARGRRRGGLLLRLASSRTKSTGNILNVDAGNLAALQPR